MSQAPTTRAAQYLRMSTEHQRYSLANQAEAIAAYADAHGYQVTRTYFDPGVSGLTFRERPGLQALLAAALAPRPEFDIILVLDVSRWGRFQDLDQSAHYEFLCRDAGIPVIYCAESFRDERTAEANILKMLKRMMAAEFSRELSVKIKRAKLRNARLGRHCGGPAPYGFRRMLVDANGQQQGLLPAGSRKAFFGEYVVLVHGPPEELAAVRRVFRLFVDRRWGETAIARRLHREGISSGERKQWTPELVRSILRNELTTGVRVFNQSTQALKTKARKLPPEEWVRTAVLPPIITSNVFARAQALRGKRTFHFCDEGDMLTALRRLWRKCGRLNAKIIDDCPDTPCSQSYVRYFGSLNAAYDAVGYARQYRWGAVRYRSDSEDVQLLELLRTAYERHGRLTVAMINADPTLPSECHYRKRFGSLAEAFRRAGLPRTEGRAPRGTGPQRKIAGVDRRRSAWSNDALLELLRELQARDGYVSGRTLRSAPDGPRVALYQERFGTLTRAYRLAGIADLQKDKLSHAALGRRHRFGFG